MITGKTWEAWEDGELRRLYPEHGANAVMAALPHRSRRAVMSRAAYFNIKRTGAYRRYKNQWSAEAKELIRRHYPTLGPVVMHSDYFPHRSYASIVSMARYLGVSYTEQKPRQVLESSWPVPAHDLMEQLDCIRLRKWGGAQPNARFGVPMIGAAA